MPALPFARQSQSTTAQSLPPIFGASRITHSSAGPNDPIQPLRAMADRVGKEVEKFAERVDTWHTHGNESKRSKHQTTVKMVKHFRDLAESHVKELKKVHDQENKGALNTSVRQRIRTMADSVNYGHQNDFGSSLQSNAPYVQSSAENPNLRDLRQWQAELATWELLRIVIDQYQHEPEVDIAAKKRERLAKVGGTGPQCKKSEIWERFLLVDDQAREKALVLRWLQQTAQNSDSDIESITAELEAASGKGTHTWTSGWLDTKAKIKQAKRLEGSDQPLNSALNLKSADKTRTLVTQLDPDAATRQKRVLEKADEYYERALWMVCYELLRRGVPWKQIVDYCHERNEAWRGVSLGVAHDEQLEGSPNLAGQDAGYLYRRMCFYAARGARHPYEAAAYGMLSGDLDKVLNVARSWDDYLHAYYNALLKSRFDSYLQRNHPDRVPQSLAQKFVFQDAVANIGDWGESPQRVIEILKQQKTTSGQAISPMKLIQGALISRTVDELVLKVGVALTDLMQKDERPQSLIIHADSAATNRGPKPAGEERTYTAERCYQTLASDPHALRILVHISIIYSNGFFATDTDAGMDLMVTQNVIAAYIELLRLNQKISLIPMYAAQLIPERAAYTLARILPDIKNGEEQKHCVDLLKLYRIDPIKVIAQNFLFSFKHCGFTYWDENGFTQVTDPIQEFKFVGRVEAGEVVLWPGLRVLAKIPGLEVDAKDEAIIEALQWYHYVGNDYKQTFLHLKIALTIFLLSGRVGAAYRVVDQLSVETISLSRTEALCGYPFDFTQAGAEEQNERELHDHRDSLSPSARAAAIPHAELPDEDKHRAIVEDMRRESTDYYNLQQIVRVLMFFRDWRAEEETLIKLRNERATDPTSPRSKPDTQHTKDLLDQISNVIHPLIASLSQQSHGLGAKPTFYTGRTWVLLRAYMPNILLAYLSVLQSASFFLHRDPAVQAMDVGVMVADEENAWLQKCLLEAGMMKALVATLAKVSQAMLVLAEHGDKAKDKKKRGGKGETLKVWDLGSR